MSSESALGALSLYYQESGFHTDIYSSEDLRCYFKESSCGCVAQATDFRSWSGGQFSKNPPSVWESRLNLPQALGQSLCQGAGGGGGSQLKWSIFSEPHSTPSYKALVVHQWALPSTASQYKYTSNTPTNPNTKSSSVGWNITKHCAALLKLLPTLSIFIAQETQEATVLESSQFWGEKYLPASHISVKLFGNIYFHLILPALFKIQIQKLATHSQLSIFLQYTGNGGH